jgi:Fe-S-cluster containining protein
LETLQVEATGNPCLACAACCAHFRVSFYFGELAGQPGGWVPVELTTKVNDFRAAMKGTEKGEGRCIALRGEVGESGAHCAIYQSRPSTCREFDPWFADGTPNPDCQRMRVQRGLTALNPKSP